MKKAIALVALAGLATVASAQGTGAIRYETSVGGDAWQTGLRTVTPGTTVNVRVVVSWDVPGALGFAGAQPDFIIDNAGAGDAVSNIERPVPFNFAPQTIVSSRFGNSIKIDDSRDTLGPGLGTRGVTPGQGVQAFTPNFSTANPAVIFTFSYTPDATATVRDLRFTFIAPTGGNTTDRIFRVYTSANGAQATPTSTVTGASIAIPAPGALALLGLGGLAAGRRRR
ncbi:MAG: hypothetical protein SFZ23_08105 [Planctomycetota bacterium]|nr:hypothetical protein [Planctomycetota bacterium]